ncbi:histidine phosphatase family protein [Neisseria perflava]|uniref:histidine phosphatase family protein n=1 Tax=Neisseria perflava TaxID=33053 RepID=UPI00209F42AA|nr:histidine phosphatase family protein [Neisseria perflava]MCP1660775.1 putative phosphoglycerate mutase [Neisseria perflava]MCP1771458.1 putative phosphoglycerate mutase [Neisseria perflava]
MALEIYLVRHGKTVFNITGRTQGWSDSPLLPEGIAAAENLGKVLNGKIRFDAAFCSGSPRAYQTAKLILNNQGQGADLPLQVVEDVREYNFGGLEGANQAKLYEQIAEKRGYADVPALMAAYRDVDHHLIAESIHELDPYSWAESEAQFVGRLKKGFQTVADLSPADGRVLLVSHGMVVTTILKTIAPQDTLYQSVENVSVTRLQYENGKWTILSIGEKLA